MVLPLQRWLMESVGLMVLLSLLSPQQLLVLVC